MITEETIKALAVEEQAIVERIAGDISARTAQVAAAAGLIKEGCTVPFISRYRKEATGGLDEVQVREVSHRLVSYTNLEERRLEIIRGIFAQGKLTDDLYANLRKCGTVTELEDIYAPFKKKKKTRGMIARERGLEPLALIILENEEAVVLARAPEFIRKDAENPELSVETPEEAIQGAMDIIAENVSQDPENRAAVKSLYLNTGSLVVKGIGDEAEMAQSVYKMYWDYREPLSTLKPHRVLAVNRGEREGKLDVKIEVDEDAAVGFLLERCGISNRFHSGAIDDGLRRLLSPAVLRELRADASLKADEHGIGVFSANLKNLLMQPPIKGTRILGIDPGIRTGSKCAALDETGKRLDHFVINQERDPDGAKKAIAAAVKKHRVRIIAVGNGTAGRDVRKAASEAVAENGLDAAVAIVDEDGASVYSASDTAREEFPDLDLTIRGAISIGRRLQDPLAELVKIDPKAIGVGLYQHDVNQKKLSETLDEVVGSVVNNVGVNINTASPSLLRYVSGINASLARKIVTLREEAGKITSREMLMKVPGMGPKIFEQCAGFLKVPESANPLDNTWVHPENYLLAAEILPLVKVGAGLTREKREELKARFGVGETTLEDITSELARPNRDPRDDLPKPVLQQGVIEFEDLREGMRVTGKVKNVVDFGAFVDIGIKETGLIHVSEMGEGFIKDPMSVLKVGDVKEFRVIGLDPARRRISLSLKPEGLPASQAGRLPPKGSKAEAERGGKTAQRRPERPPNGESRDDTLYNPFADLLKKPKT